MQPEVDQTVNARAHANSADERGDDKQPKPDTNDDRESENLFRQDVNEEPHQRPFPQELAAAHRERHEDASLLRGWHDTRLMFYYSNCVHQKFLLRSRPAY